MLNIPYSNCKVNFSKTTSTNNFKITPENLFARCNFLVRYSKTCTMWNLYQTHLRLELCSNQGWLKYMMTQVFETNQNVVIWLVKWFDMSWFEIGYLGFHLSWFESGYIGLDLKILADLICDFFFHLKSERHL